jgi:hypothetical protein
MPLDHGCRLHQHHGVEDLRPNPVEPHPREPVCGEDPNPTFALPPQDGHLMPKRGNLKFQGGAATNTEGEQGNQGGKNRHHAYDGMTATQKPLGFRHDSEF